MSDYGMESIIDSTTLLSSIDKMGVGVAITDPNLEDNPLVYVNQGFEKITGYTREEVLMRNLRFLYGKETDQSDLETIRTAIREQKTASVTIKNYKKDGSPFWNQFVISPIHAADGSLAYFIGLQFDVTSKMEAQFASERRIELLSNFDPLTGLLNNNGFKQKLELYFTQMKNNPQSAAVIRLNLNRFRYINESYGENIGNDVLIEVAVRLQQTLPKGTPICRSFADDFIVLLSGFSDPLQVHTTAMELNDTLRQPYTLAGESLCLSFAMGISLYPDDGPDSSQLLKHAELAMKVAKAEALNGPHYFDYYLMDKLMERVNIEKKMPRALAEGQFVLHYQPKIDAKTRRLTGLEALIRWKDPEQEQLISPGTFIPIAEDTGFIVQLGEWVLWEACQTNKKWQDAGYPKVPVSVNVSAVQFSHPYFVQMVTRILERTGLEPKYLELEVTESLLNDPIMIKEKLNSLKEQGIKLSLDDFGTGYSSIYYLKTLPLQVLKIDRTFIQQTPTCERDSSLLRSIIDLGKSLGMTVLAEGVETEEQFKFLQEIGCDQIQGYYYSKPLEEQALEQLLVSANSGVT